MIFLFGETLKNYFYQGCQKSVELIIISFPLSMFTEEYSR
jgi:hypothetical protein